MKLYLIRHAESTNNAIVWRTGLYKDWVPDPGLTEIGHQQAERLAQLLASQFGEPLQPPPSKQTEFGITHLYCSLMTRAILTAMPIAEACGLRLMALDNIFERGGIFKINQDSIRVGLPGPTRHYFRERFPTLILPESVGDRGWYDRPFETESMFLERMKKVVPEIINRHAETKDTVALVTHGDFIDQFVNQLMGVERHPKNYESIFQINWFFSNASISRISFITGSPIVVYLNRLDHLSPELMM